MRLRDRIETLPIPVHLCIGNHDERPVFAEVFPERLDANGFVQTVAPFSYGKGILIDTWAPETHAGFFCETRAEWLNSVLSEMDAPAWFFLHHNPAPTHIGPMDQIMLLDAGRFGDLVERHRAKIAHIFHGHCHLPLSGSFRGVLVSAPRGTNHAGWANFGEKNLLSGSYLPEAYSVIFASQDAVTVHMVEYGYDGEVMIEASPDYASWDRSVMVRRLSGEKVTEGEGH
ncbi:MAG: metallophosphoesterase [Pseudomonadota bacterium]